ncbi:MAG TPA: PASTA domain-containing protein [Acidimicrobiales bacterium]|nr:PASTA domain-containing protein [Acidimicrobiales bacterium]
MATAHMTEQLGRVLGGRYRLTAAIGTGSSAEVYQADDVTLRRRVAVKVLHPGLAGDEAFLRRFRAEARAAAALSHPHIMAVYDWGEDDGPYLVLEFLGGGSLRGMLDRGTRLSLSQALVVGLATARALDFAHRKGFVHRDIKPANLLFGDDGRLRIADFGLARALSEAAWTEPGDGLVGTARYAAPEQASGGRIDGKADVYALGLVLIEAVTGSVPLVGESTLATIARRADAPVPVPEAMGPLGPVLERLVQPDPAERLDAGALGKALLVAAGELDRPEPLPLAGAVDVTVVSGGDVDPTLLPSPSKQTTVTATSGDEPEGTGDHTTVVRSGPTTAVFDGLEMFDRDVAPTDDTPVPPGRRRGGRLWLVVALVLLLGVAGAGYAYIRSLPPTAVVPSVVNFTRDDANAELFRVQEAAQLEWLVTSVEDDSEVVAEGLVISQTPPPGTELEDGATVTLVVSTGLPFVEVPDLDERSVEDATAALANAGLALGEESAAPHESVEAGLVIDWTVEGQPRPAELRKGSAVDVVVSSGPAPRTITNLAGTTPDQAEAELKRIGLEADFSERFSTSVEKGLVIGTDPGSGSKVERGETVAVVVSKGRDLVVVPDFEGKTFEEFKQALIDAGLLPDDVSGNSRGDPSASDPEPGERVERGSAVDIFLRK